MNLTRFASIKALAGAALALAGLAAATGAQARDVYWSVGVNAAPGVSVGFGNYVAPQPVYVQPHPVYVEPYPVYVQPRPVYVQPRPVYVQPRPVYVQPAYPVNYGYGYGRPPGHWKHGHKHWKHHGHDGHHGYYRDRGDDDHHGRR